MRLIIVLMLLINIAAACFGMFYTPNIPVLETGEIPWRAFPILAGLNLVFFILLIITKISVWLKKNPTIKLNIPNKEYWSREENQYQCTKMCMKKLNTLVILTLSMIFILTIACIQVNSDEQKSVELLKIIFYPIMGIYLICTILWKKDFTKAFQIPK